MSKLLDRQAEAPGERQRASAGRERFVQLAEIAVDVRQERTDLTTPAVVVQPFGEALGLAQPLQGPPEFAELVQHHPQLQADLEGLLQRGRALGQGLEAAERLLEPGQGVRERGPRGGLQPGLSEVVRRLLAQLAPGRVMGEPLDLSSEAVPVRRLDRLDDPRVKLAATFLQQSAVRDLVSERVLEGVLEIREQAALVEELGALQVVEAAPERPGKPGKRGSFPRGASECKTRAKKREARPRSAWLQRKPRSRYRTGFLPDYDGGRMDR